MSYLTRRLLLLGSAGFVVAAPNSEPEQQFLFANDEFEIRMTLEYHDNEPNKNLRFKERSKDRNFCLSLQGEENRNCVTNFTGSIAVARYRISSHAEPQASPLLREYVRSIDQSERVPVRPPFEREIESQPGYASVIQVFGYQDNSPEASGRVPEDDAWCLLRQNLYLQTNRAPFLVVHWKHTLNRIRVLDVIPESGTHQIVERR